MKDLKIKPAREGMLFICYLSLIPYFLVSFSIYAPCLWNVVSASLLWILMVSTTILLVIVTYFIARISYTHKLVVTENEIIKYKRGKVVFRIKKEDIIELYFEKISWKEWLFQYTIGIFFLMLTEGGLGVFQSTLSIRFYSAEIESERKFDGEKLSTLTYEEMGNNIKEFCELITERQLKKVIKKINLPVRYWEAKKNNKKENEND